MVHVQPRSLVVYSDIGCPWAHLAIYRLLAARSRLGLEEEVVLDLRAFPLELFNKRPTPKRILDMEIPVAGALEPKAGWQTWQRPEFEYPVTMLPALEAVHAAREQGARASEQLTRALRIGFFGESRCISLRHEILEIAGGCPAVDRKSLEDRLDEGSARRSVMEDFREAQKAEVKGSPHVFSPDGSDAHNPGTKMHWEGDHGLGFPVIDSDNPEVYDDLLARAAGR